MFTAEGARGMGGGGGARTTYTSDATHIRTWNVCHEVFELVRDRGAHAKHAAPPLAEENVGFSLAQPPKLAHGNGVLEAGEGEQ
jgi:hypothetical protein